MITPASASQAASSRDKFSDSIVTNNPLAKKILHPNMVSSPSQNQIIGSASSSSSTRSGGDSNNDSYSRLYSNSTNNLKMNKINGKTHASSGNTNAKWATGSLSHHSHASHSAASRTSNLTSPSAITHSSDPTYASLSGNPRRRRGRDAPEGDQDQEEGDVGEIGPGREPRGGNPPGLNSSNSREPTVSLAASGFSREVGVPNAVGIMGRFKPTSRKIRHTGMDLVNYSSSTRTDITTSTSAMTSSPESSHHDVILSRQIQEANSSSASNSILPKSAAYLREGPPIVSSHMGVVNSNYSSASALRKSHGSLSSGGRGDAPASVASGGGNGGGDENVGTFTIPTFKEMDDDLNNSRGRKIKIHQNYRMADRGSSSASDLDMLLVNDDSTDDESDGYLEKVLCGISEPKRMACRGSGAAAARPTSGGATATTSVQSSSSKNSGGGGGASRPVSEVPSLLVMEGSVSGSQGSSSKLSGNIQRSNSSPLEAALFIPLVDKSSSTLAFDPSELRTDDGVSGAALAAPVVTVNPVKNKTSSSKRSSAQRRRTVSVLTKSQLGRNLDDLIGDDSDDASRPPPNALSNIPVLPTIRTIRAKKTRPDEPAGLFLTKSKNGAVLVHSFSPESLFRHTSLQPGQEVLSVNEKRVNDPKMAATLITQAKGSLALRVSTSERPRGFQYCQVKRKGSAVDNVTASNNPSGGGGTGKVGTENDRSGASHHGIRFITASIDGVRRGSLVTEGLVRITHLDQNGLFGNSHPLNRLRVGGIVLAINGVPVTNGRTALERVMGSRHLVEVLHCDERVWREDWVKDGLQTLQSGVKKEVKVNSTSIFGKSEKRHAEDDANKDLGENDKPLWDLKWKSEREEAIITKNDQEYAFKLKFDEDVGTCHSEPVDDVMMPPMDELDVSALVELVNGSQRTVMKVLQNMLRRAKFEIKVTNSQKRRKNTGAATVASAGAASAGTDDSRALKNVMRIQSYDALAMLLADDDSNVEELSTLASSLTGNDSRSRERRRQQDPSNDKVKNSRQKGDPLRRRRSTGVVEALLNVSSTHNLEFWELEGLANMSTANKTREYPMDKRKNEEWSIPSRSRKDSERRHSANSLSSYASSMFSADMLEEFLDDLDDISLGNSMSSSSNSSDICIAQNDAPPSPRQEAAKLGPKALLSTKHHKDSSSLPDEKKTDDEKAYITGVLRDVASKYDIDSKIVGSGGFGEVRDCVDKKSGQVYVVKTILKPAQDDTTKVNLIRNEILLLHEANHPNIIELKDLFEDDKYVHIVMERCTGGDLFDRVVNENPRRLRSRSDGIKHEARTANAMRSILNVIKYLHSKGIVHRDIKPEHFLLSTDKRETQKIKLIDFGLARKHKPGNAPMTTFTGSPSFVAPEVIARSYDHMCDMFSVGVTAYFLLTGLLPFDGPTDEETFQLISAGKFKFPSSSSVCLSDDAKDFITKLLKTDPKERMTSEQALNHPWMLKAASC